MLGVQNGVVLHVCSRRWNSPHVLFSDPSHMSWATLLSPGICIDQGASTLDPFYRWGNWPGIWRNVFLEGSVYRSFWTVNLKWTPLSSSRRNSLAIYVFQAGSVEPLKTDRLWLFNSHLKILLLGLQFRATFTQEGGSYRNQNNSASDTAFVVQSIPLSREQEPNCLK